MRRPIDPPINITGDRASHAEYGVGPATDYGCNVGAPVYAPFAGRLSTYVTDVGGLGVILWGADAAFYGQHLWVRMSPGDYSEGDRIALSGNTGTQTTGPHLHCYVIIRATGERLSMEEYLGRASAAAGTARPFPATPPQTGMPDMLLFNGVSAPQDFYLATYDGRRLKIRPTLGTERRLLLNAVPAIPRAQLTDDEVVDLCAQGGYVWDAANARGLYDGAVTY